MTPPAAAATVPPAVRRARTLAPGRPLTTAPRPRRVSGPARRARQAGEERRSAAAEGGLVLGALAALRGVDGHPLLDRLIGGRAWIAFLAFALIGIVTLQLGLLQLNAGIGRKLEREASLQRENASLSIENSELAAGSRIESSAARMGMQLVQAGELRYLTPNHSANVARAAAAASAQAHEAASPAQSEASAATTATPASSSGGEQATSTAPAEQPSGEVSSSAQTGEAAEGAAALAPSEAASATATPQAASPAPEPQASTGSAGAGADSAGEASPAGGTQAGPTG